MNKVTSNIKEVFRTLIYLLILFPIFAQGEKPAVAVTKLTPNYLRWLKSGDSSLTVIDMYPMKTDSALRILEYCSGLLITGGEDIHPSLYGKADQLTNCQETDVRRDSLEIALIKKALSLRMPIFGICRGEQILNVTLGGSLITDIPTHLKDHHLLKKKGGESSPSLDHTSMPVSTVHQCDDYLKCYHPVTILPSTLLGALTMTDMDSVTSNHHQAVDILAPGLRFNSMSEDGLIEGIEWEDPRNKSFLIGVQWHPERMGLNSKLSGPLIIEFIHQINNFYKTSKHY